MSMDLNALKEKFHEQLKELRSLKKKKHEAILNTNRNGIHTSKPKSTVLPKEQYKIFRMEGKSPRKSP